MKVLFHSLLTVILFVSVSYGQDNDVKNLDSPAYLSSQFDHLLKKSRLIEDDIAQMKRIRQGIDAVETKSGRLLQEQKLFKSDFDKLKIELEKFKIDLKSAQQIKEQIKEKKEESLRKLIKEDLFGIDNRINELRNRSYSLKSANVLSNAYRNLYSRSDSPDIQSLTQKLRDLMYDDMPPEPFPLGGLDDSGASREMLGAETASLEILNRYLEDWTPWADKSVTYFDSILNQAQKLEDTKSRMIGEIDTATTRLAKERSSLNEQIQKMDVRLKSSKGRQESSNLSTNIMMGLLGFMFIATICLRYRHNEDEIITDRTLIEFGGMSFLLLTVIILAKAERIESATVGPLLGTIAGYIFGKSMSGEEAKREADREKAEREKAAREKAELERIEREKAARKKTESQIADLEKQIQVYADAKPAKG